MCELFAMSANTPVVVRYDLNRFAAEGGERHQNRDGWGIVFSDGNDAHYYREAASASNSPLDRFVREHAEPHLFALAHVRRASQGNRSLANTHPFRRVLHGRPQHFAHNGNLTGLERTAGGAAVLGERVGETDSELAFLMLLERIRHISDDPADIKVRFGIFRQFCADMAALGAANFLWLDGEVLYVHADRRRHETGGGLTEPRAPGLHMLSFQSHAPAGPHDCVGASLENLPEKIVLFASLPLSEGPWEMLPQGEVVAVARGKVLHRGNTAAFEHLP